MQTTLLKNLLPKSPLNSQQKVNTNTNLKQKKSLFFSLNLTTLIDAFCILVIFLLSNMNGRVQNIQQSEKLILPTAVKTELLEAGLVVKIEKDQFYIDEKQVDKNNLMAQLLAAFQKNKTPLIIQADKKAAFDQIAMVMKAGGQAGFEKYIFAVLPGI